MIYNKLSLKPVLVSSCDCILGGAAPIKVNIIFVNKPFLGKFPVVPP